MVAFAILKLDDSLVEEIKTLDIDNYLLSDFLEARTGQRYGNRYDLEMYAELESVVEAIYHKTF